MQRLSLHRLAFPALHVINVDTGELAVCVPLPVPKVCNNAGDVDQPLFVGVGDWLSH